MIIIGIDPGSKNGGLARHDDDGVELIRMPDTIKGIVDFFNGVYIYDHIFIEKWFTMPRDGRVGAAKYGHHNGVLEAAIVASGIPYTMVPPKEWQKLMHAGTDSGLEPKKRSVQAFMRLFPGVQMNFGKMTKPHLGAVEAGLIAAYGQRVLSGQEMKAGA